MKSILVIGAGRSASSLISYLLSHSQSGDWKVTVGDTSLELAQSKIMKHPNGTAIHLDILQEERLHNEIQKSDLVISMLPASMHLSVAKGCLKYNKHLVTASYLTPEMQKLDSEVTSKGLLFLNECGLDPGIDHMSAMEIINSAKEQGLEVSSFRSYCGGIISPEYNTNPWGYKFTWNPRNVILAGQGGPAHFLSDGVEKTIPYERLFTEINTVSVRGWGQYDAYANRDSLNYQDQYGLTGIPTLLRGTLRMAGFCKGWNSLIKLGLTQQHLKLTGMAQNTWLDLLTILGTRNQEDFLKSDPEIMEKLNWLGIFSKEPLGLDEGSPADFLQKLLEKKWALDPQDKDLIILQHEFEFNGKFKESNQSGTRLISSMVVKGQDGINTGMAMTVGYPMAIATEKILKGEIALKGVKIPISKEIYEPVLQGLKKLGIEFRQEILD